MLLFYNKISNKRRPNWYKSLAKSTSCKYLLYGAIYYKVPDYVFFSLLKHDNSKSDSIKYPLSSISIFSSLISLWTIYFSHRCYKANTMQPIRNYT